MCLCVWVYLCLSRFSGEAQQVLTGPPSSLHSPYKPHFLVCVCVCTHVSVCVDTSWLDLLSVGLILKWLTAEQSQGGLRAVVGREGPYSLGAFIPKGDFYSERETNTEKGGRESLNRLIWYTAMWIEWINEHKQLKNELCLACLVLTGAC